ncbi:hypothetical protein FRC07_010192 [Ceratobasidium sp. 392]|nr:hypothetical protein FRC07_010192 [Ceratobasidium sp. 392]
MTPTRKNILDIPEVVTLIDSFQDPCDCASLARTSRRLFNLLMPLLWEHLHGLSWIAPLVPALNGPKEDGEGNKAVAKALAQSHFTRLNIYAPWIKHIEVDEGHTSSLEENQLDALFAYSANHILLPNLTSLKVIGFVDVSWVTMFISPSLLNLEFEHDNAFEDYRVLCAPEWSLLLYYLAERSPKLQTLLVFPQNFRKDKLHLRVEQFLPNDAKATIGRQLADGLSPFLANLPPLLKFTTCGEIFDKACFTTISTWSTLESLTIHMNRNKRDYTLPTLDDAAFPSLTSLALYWIPDFDAFRMLWDASALVSKLTTVKLLPSHELSYYTNKEAGDTFSQIMSTLAEKSPCLEKVWLLMLHPDFGRPNFDIKISALDICRHLALRSLYVGGVVIEELRSFDDFNPQGDSNLIEYFAAAFPFDFDLFDLPIGANLEAIPRYRKSPFFKLEANFFGLSDDGGEPGIRRFSCCDAILFANYLFSLWPDVRIDAQVHEFDDENRAVHRNMIELINKQLHVLSSCNLDPSLKYEDVQLLNEESWAECWAGLDDSGSEYGNE